MPSENFLKIYSVKKTWIIMIFAIGFGSFLLSAVIPSFMSPDEFDHVKRAYGLSQGQIVLESPAQQSSGVRVDTGLLQYIDTCCSAWMKNRSHKFSADEIAAGSTVQWTGEKMFSPAPGTGYYFPLIYAPQAVGLALGKMLGLTIDTSYRLARLLSLATAITLLVWAVFLYEPPLLAIALFMMPMTLFQLASASLDAVSSTMAVLVISIFLKIVTHKYRLPVGLAVVFGMVLFLLISSRVYLLPLLALPFTAYFATKQKSLLITGASSTLAVFLWLVIATTSTIDTRVVTGAPTSAIVYYYAVNPLEYFKVLYDTLSQPHYIGIHFKTFIGHLGWFDTPLPTRTYFTLSSMLALITILTFTSIDFTKHFIARSLLFFSSILSVMLIFLALLVTWNQHPALHIEGIQGRYFLVPAILLAYSVSSPTYRASIPRRIGLVLLCAFITYSTYATLRTTVNKYYISETQAP